MWGRPGEIRGVDLLAPREHIMPTVAGSALAAPAALHAHHGSQLVLWADRETGEVKSIPLRGGGVRVVADSGGQPLRALALDWAAGLLYYCAGATLYAANLAGEYTTPLAHDLHNMTALAADPLRGRLYWALAPAAGERLEAADGAAGDRRLLLDAHTDRALSGATSECLRPPTPGL